MRNTILTVFGIILFLTSNSQTATDSTQMKLQQYKQWLDMGLIDKPEYDILKGKLLLKEEKTISGSEKANAEPEKEKSVKQKPTPVDLSYDTYVRERKIDTMQLNRLKERVTLKFIAAGLFTVAGAGTFGILLGTGPFNVKTFASIATVGAASLASGIVLFVSAGIDRQVYVKRKKTEVALSFTPAGLICQF